MKAFWLCFPSVACDPYMIKHIEKPWAMSKPGKQVIEMLSMCAHGCRWLVVMYCSIDHLSCESFTLLSFYLPPITKITRIQQRLLRTLFVHMFLACSHPPAQVPSNRSKNTALTVHRRWFVSKCTLLAPKSEVHDPRIPFFLQKTGSLGLFCS